MKKDWRHILERRQRRDDDAAGFERRGDNYILLNAPEHAGKPFTQIRYWHDEVLNGWWAVRLKPDGTPLDRATFTVQIATLEHLIAEWKEPSPCH